LALDMVKYQKLFLEEAGEHVGDISRALLELEKDTQSSASIDTVFRMAHSIKSMAASVGHDSVADLAHRLEDRLGPIRTAGRLSSPDELSLLFRGLEGLERMLDAVRREGEAPAPDAELIADLARPREPQPAEALPASDPSAVETAKKKLLS
jgi:two-component system chemotaxis sensor kinase CheA